MNEKRIQQVLDIEKQAQTVYDSAVNEAKQIPLQAEQEAQAIVAQARTEAEKQAKDMVTQAHSEAESQKILDDAQAKITKSEALARQNFRRAVTEVLSRIVGKE